MKENFNYPWYLQQTSAFTTLYNGFYPIAETASPLGLGDAFNIDMMTGAMLFRLGTYWGMTGSPYLWDGLIYDIDNWTEIKTWTGGLKELGEQLYSNLIKAKAYATGRVYSLSMLKEVISRALAGEPHTVEVREGLMEFTISLTASRQILETFIEAKAFDLAFIGKPAGIKVNWEYHYE